VTLTTPETLTSTPQKNLATRHVALIKPQKMSCHPSCDAHNTTKNLAICHVTLTTPQKNLAVRHVTLKSPLKMSCHPPCDANKTTKIMPSVM
jgi:hypothetical protein